ncbi:hypothetical protein ACFQ9Z_14950 [Streptomyces sp. NPDC056580]|uniref:hypothetical protein n=1 Tax=Streptomyces sp. NPDC056580 TaxID=3345872 RepID=UPI0036BF8E07
MPSSTPTPRPLAPAPRPAPPHPGSLADRGRTQATAPPAWARPLGTPPPTSAPRRRHVWTTTAALAELWRTRRAITGVPGVGPRPAGPDDAAAWDDLDARVRTLTGRRRALHLPPPAGAQLPSHGRGARYGLTGRGGGGRCFGRCRRLWRPGVRRGGRRGVVAPGPVRLEGRAWSGWAPVTGVEVGTDGGPRRGPAVLAPDDGHRWAWRRWTCEWSAEPGDHVLSVRARDAAGNTQPLEQAWNRGGFANNLVQRVPVFCPDPGGAA